MLPFHIQSTSCPAPVIPVVPVRSPKLVSPVPFPLPRIPLPPPGARAAPPVTPVARACVAPGSRGVAGPLVAAVRGPHSRNVRHQLAHLRLEFFQLHGYGCGYSILDFLQEGGKSWKYMVTGLAALLVVGVLEWPISARLVRNMECLTLWGRALALVAQKARISIQDSRLSKTCSSSSSTHTLFQPIDTSKGGD